MSSKTAEGRATREGLLVFLRTFRDETGYWPTREEIADGLDMSQGSLDLHLTSLRDQGYLQWQRGRFSRTLRITRKSREALE